jgi:methylisocitrate lyase
MSTSVPLHAGRVLRQAITAARLNGTAVQLLGAPTAYSAMQAEKAGATCLYLSGSGVATVSYGLPDLGITSINDVVADVERITRASRLPLLVDADTGFGSSAFCIARAIRDLDRAGAAGCHLEDQAAAKRCGHRPGKQIISVEEMVDRIAAAREGRAESGSEDFVIMARTDALASEGMDGALRRAEAYVAAGADMLFPEAVTELEQYRRFHEALPETPILANITEFGQTELFSVKELSAVGVGIVLYPLSAQRAMAKAAAAVYESIIKQGHQRDVVDLMQTRKELYATLDYHKYEETLDRLFKKGEK